MNPVLLRVVLLSPPFNPLHLFRSGAQGWWYDNADFSTLFEDSAGTTPVTAVERPVGKQLDKSGRENHRVQATAASRPTLSARYNLLTKTETPSDATIWQVYGAATVTAGVTDPNGGTTAAQIDMPTANTGLKLIGPAKVTGIAYAPSVYLKADAPGTIRLFDGTGQAWDETVNVTTEWTQFTPAPVAATGTNAAEFAVYRNSGQLAKVYVAFPDLRLTTDTTGKGPAYQRVDTATSYDTNGFLVDEDFDGVDDSYTGTTGGGGTTGFFYCAAHRIDGGAGTVRTLISDRGTNTGYRVCINASNKLELSAGNGVAFTAVESAATLSVGTTYVIAAWHDGVNLYVQINQGAIASTAFATATAGSASFTVGKSNTAASEFLNGLLYGDIYVQNGGVSDANRAKTQRWLAVRSGVTL